MVSVTTYVLFFIPLLCIFSVSAAQGNPRIFAWNNLTNLAIDLELNLALLKSIITTPNLSLELSQELENLLLTLDKFADAFYRPKLLIQFCDRTEGEHHFHALLVKKYQRELSCPWCERVDFNSLKTGIFRAKLPAQLNTGNITATPGAVEEITSAILAGRKIFENKFTIHHQYVAKMRVMLKKHIFLRVNDEVYAKIYRDTGKRYNDISPWSNEGAYYELECNMKYSVDFHNLESAKEMFVKIPFLRFTKIR